MKYILALIAILLANTVNAQELQHFNPAILGKSVDDNIVLLLPASNNAIKPINILTDINEKDGKFYAATVIYQNKISFEDARISINKLYKKYEEESFAKNPLMGLWRNEDKGFSIQLTINEDENVIQVIYISFVQRNTTEPVVRESTR